MGTREEAGVRAGEVTWGIVCTIDLRSQIALDAIHGFITKTALRHATVTSGA